MTAIEFPAETRAYWIEGPGRGTLRTEPTISAEVATTTEGFSVICAEFGGISPGTERLVGRGEVPPDCATQMACRYMAGTFDLPLKYGYCVVGRGVHGALSGQRVFAMHPHQEWFAVRDRDAVALPETIPGPRATLLPNLETALNAVWDSRAEPGLPALVIGAGPVGLLIAFVRHALGHGPTTLVDVDHQRLTFAGKLDWVQRAIPPEELGPDPGFPLAFHATGHEGGLQLALSALAFEGTVIELSWFGSRRVTLDLGGAFHYRRLTIRASQVAAVAPCARGADGGYTRRTAKVLELLGDRQLDTLLMPPFAFDELPLRMHSLYADSPERDALPIVPVLVYPSDSARPAASLSPTMEER